SPGRSLPAPIRRASSKASGCPATWARAASPSWASGWSRWTPSATCCSCAARCPARSTGSSRCASREAGVAMIEAPHYSATGTKKKAVRLPAALFDGTVNEYLLHRAVITYLANQRQGTHDTRTRSEVSGGNQKPWRQKGTGRARQGSTRAPHWRHGGIVFGPHPRSYRLGIPKKLRQLAKKSALNARARESALFVVDPLEYEKPRTKVLAELLDKLGVADRKVLLLTAGQPAAHNVYLSGRNLPRVRVMRFADVTAYEILWSDAVLVELPALGAGSAATEAADA